MAGNGKQATCGWIRLHPAFCEYFNPMSLRHGAPDVMPQCSALNQKSQSYSRNAGCGVPDASEPRGRARSARDRGLCG